MAYTHATLPIISVTGVIFDAYIRLQYPAYIFTGQGYPGVQDV